MVLIADRPAEIEDRAVPGHWEGDLMLGVRGQSAIATLVERQTRYVNVTGRRPRQDESPCVRAHREEDQNAAAASRRCPSRGTAARKMAGHRQFSMATGVHVYFCDPSSPWHTAAVTKIRMGCCVSTSPEEPTCQSIASGT